MAVDSVVADDRPCVLESTGRLDVSLLKLRRQEFFASSLGSRPVAEQCPGVRDVDPQVIIDTDFDHRTALAPYYTRLTKLLTAIVICQPHDSRRFLGTLPGAPDLRELERQNEFVLERYRKRHSIALGH